MHLSSGDKGRLDFAEDAQHKALHVNVLLKNSLYFSDSEFEHFHLLRQSLRVLLVVLFESEAFSLISLVPVVATILLVVSLITTKALFASAFHLNVGLLMFLASAILVAFTFNLDSWWLLLVHGHSQPLLSSLSLQCLEDHVEFEAEVLITHSRFLGSDRVAGPFSDGVVANAVNLTELGEDFLNLIVVFFSILTLEDKDDLLDNLALTI